MASPLKRRSGTLRSLAGQPMRQTRSMARLAAPAEPIEEPWTGMAPSHTPRNAVSAPDRHEELELSDGLSDTETNPRKQALRNSLNGRHAADALAEERGYAEVAPPQTEASRTHRRIVPSSQARRYDFGPDSPRVLQRQQPKMESPRKGRVDDFEFELERSLYNFRAERDEEDVQISNGEDPSDLGLPRPRATRPMAVPASPKPAVTKERRPGRVESDGRASSAKSSASVRTPSPSKTLTVPNPFKLQEGSRLSSTQSTRGELAKRPHSTVSPSASNESIKAVGPRKVGQASSRSHIFKSARAAESAATGKLLEASMRSEAFAPTLSDQETCRSPSRSKAPQLGEAKLSSPLGSRGSPFKAAVAASDLPFSRSSSRKPIDLSKLKPSPGKARRGMFLHEADEPEDSSLESNQEPKQQSAEDEDEDEYVLTRGPLPASSSRRKLGGARPSLGKETAIAPPEASLKVETDVRQTLSSETSSALASLEASLAKLSALSHRRTGAAASKKDGTAQPPPKRTLGDSRPRILSPSKAQNAPVSQAHRSNPLVDDNQKRTAVEDGSFKRPSSFLLRSKKLAQARDDPLKSEDEGRHSTEESMTDVEAPRRGDAGASRREDGGATEAEPKRQSALKIARRRSMHSILSFGGDSALDALKREETANDVALSDLSFASGDENPTSQDPKAAEEARKAAKAARRRSLYTYVPTKREDAEAGDKSVGNLSSGLIIGGGGGGSGTASAAAAEASGAVLNSKKDRARTRFLRGLTVLVDVRDQDGEDASACWVEMLREAGAKVLVRFGERRLTHIVYKSGRPGTLHSYRALPEPKPLVVGISWVVKCLEEGRKVDEEPFIVEVGKQAIFQKRRRSSMAPRQAPASSAPRSPHVAAHLEKQLALARAKVLEHAPLVPSPLRWRCYQATEAGSEYESSDTADTAGGESDGLEKYSRTVEHVLRRAASLAVVE
ncbi:hypothetical protein ACQY0O_006937 [Thecaphora frezii]